MNPEILVGHATTGQHATTRRNTSSGHSRPSAILGPACLSHQLLAKLAFHGSTDGRKEAGEGPEQCDAAAPKEGGGVSGIEGEPRAGSPRNWKSARPSHRQQRGSVHACYDEHAIEISIGLLALLETGRKPDAAGWTRQLARRIPFAYKIMGRYFPIATDSYEDLVALEVGNAPPKEDLIEMSTLLPVVAQWHTALDIPESYRALAADMRDVFSEAHLQMWYLGEATNEHLYRSNAGRQSGMTLSPIHLPNGIDELKEQIQRLSDERREHEELSCIKQGWPILSLIVSRHYRTPVDPAFWQERVAGETSAGGEAAPENAGEGE